MAMSGFSSLRHSRKSLYVTQSAPAEGTPERSHVAVFNPGEDAIQVTLRLYDGATGAWEGEYLVGGSPLSVGGRQLVQVDGIIRAINPAADDRHKRLEVEVDGEAFVNAFRVNPDNDPVTIEAQRGP